MIDARNDRTWPEVVTGKLPAFRQGSLVKSPPFAYHASTDFPLWAATRLVDPTHESPALVELAPEDRPPYGIITTQSCDVDEEGRNRKPWVQIAPVYELPADHQELGNIQRWRVAYLAPVNNLGTCWVADLRIEFPVEKSWLVLQTPIDGYRGQREYDQFSAFCGNYRSRQAVATSIYERLLKPLELSLKVLSRDAADLYAAFVQDVEHLFLDIGGDALAPQTIQLIFVSPGSLLPRLTEQLDLWWEQTCGTDELPFTVLPNRYLSFDRVSFAESRHWREQDLARLLGSS